MKSATKATIAISTIAVLWILAVPAPAAEQADDDQTPQTLPDKDKKGDAAQPGRFLQIFQVESADAAELAAVLSQYLQARPTLGGESGRPSTTRGRSQGPAPSTVSSVSRTRSGALIIADARTNKLIVETTRKQDLEDIKTLLKNLDVPVHQNRLKARIYQVKHSRADEVATVLQDLIGTNRGPRTGSSRISSTRGGFGSRTRTPSPPAIAQATGTPQSVEFAPRIIPYLPTNSLLIQARPEDHEEILGILGEIDAKRRQVFLEVAVVQVGAGCSLNHAIELFAVEPDAEKARLGLPSTSDPTDPQSIAQEAFFTVMQKGDFPALVQFLRKSRDSQVLAHPFVLADENEENCIDIMETRFVQNTTVYSNQTTLSSQQGEDAGITLSMVPTINTPQKTILLELALTISEFIEIASGPNILPPKIQTSVTSSVTVPDGQIFVIGGLTRTSRSDAEAVDKNNLYILLRAHVPTTCPEE